MVTPCFINVHVDFKLIFPEKAFFYIYVLTTSFNTITTYNYYYYTNYINILLLYNTTILYNSLARETQLCTHEKNIGCNK